MNSENNKIGIKVNEELLIELNSGYIQEYNMIPETNKQAIQYAYERGRKDALNDLMKEVDKYNCDTGYILEIPQNSFYKATGYSFYNLCSMLVDNIR